MKNSTAQSPGWFQSSLGQWLLETEISRLGELLPSGYYPTALQVGMPERNFLRNIEVGCGFVAWNPENAQMPLQSPSEQTGVANINVADAGVEALLSENLHPVIASHSALPFSDKTHSLIVLPHTLDFCDDPHGVLREVNQILTPEGCVVIIGFNQLSLWGVSRLNPRKPSDAPWAGRHYSARRVQDWLSLLGIDIVGGSTFAYQPPLQSPRWREKLRFVDRMGDRWWPGLGAVYMIVGKKREVASSYNSARYAWRRFIPAIARPAVSSSGINSSGIKTVASGKNHLRLVVKNNN